MGQMDSWDRTPRKGFERPARRGFCHVEALPAPLSSRTVHPMKKLLLAAALTLLPAAAWSKPPHRDCGPLPLTFEGVLFTGDGDTIYGVGFKPGIRLWGMNAPELRDSDKAETIPGMRARSLVADLLTEAGHKGRCEPIEWDGYCRVVATCTTAAGKDLTLEVLKAGLAYGFYLAKHPDHLKQAEAYDQAEYDARKAGRGLWPYWDGQKPAVEQSEAKP
jgi:endonuclease YncB( thermonuclease family)